MNQIIGIDAGNYETKIVHSSGYDYFFSAIGEWRQRKASDVHSNTDMEFQIVDKYEDIRGFAGPLAAIESNYGGTIYGTTKNHQDAKVRALLAIHRVITHDKVSIIVGQPYQGHTKEEKDEIIHGLIGEHVVTVNGVSKKFEVENVRVGIEGAMAFLGATTDGPVNVIDIGSGTVNCIHFLNKRIVDRKCRTLPFGSETNMDGINYDGMASGIFKQMSGVWNKSDLTYICGGTAKMMGKVLRKYYPMTQVLQPKVNIGGTNMKVDTKFANAAGMYIAGRKAYGKVQTS